MSFAKLLEELDTMTKSFAATEGDDKGDAKIKAAATEGGAGDELDGDEDDEKDKDGGAGEMTKSFAFTLESGEVIEALDGTEMVKSLMARVSSTEGVMAKALGQTIDLIGKQGAKLAEQSEMIKSLRVDLEKLGDSGRGRKAVLQVTEKGGEQTLTKSEGTLGPKEFFAKANAAFDAGRISGKELTVIDVSLRSRTEIDQGLVAKVVG